MTFPSLISRAGLLLGSVVLLQACQSLPQSQQLRENPPDNVAQQRDIDELPFYPQQQYYCGPTTLAEIYNYYSFAITPEQIAPKLFIPGKDGSLQLEMVAASRQYNFLAYAQRGSLRQIIQLVDEARPVIVLQNLSIAWLPMWHYAVVKGYDLVKSELILHTGVTANHRVSFELFERTWQRGDYWMFVPVPAGDISEHFDPFTYIQAAYDLMQVGKDAAAIDSLQSATKHWPQQWLSFLLLGNYYLHKELPEALKWYKQGLAYGQNQASYLNNYAYGLAVAGCQKSAETLIQQAVVLAPQDANTLDTQQQIISGKLAPDKPAVSCTDF